jgi:hypothetical protein
VAIPVPEALDTTRFRPRGLLGRGSMGLVYRAYDVETGCDVALKTLPRLGADQIYRLKHEFRALATIAHPNLVELYELVVSERSCFFTMELVEGTDFVSRMRLLAARAPRAAAVLASSRLGLVRHMLRQLVGGLAAVHAAGKLHRDVKPSNVMVTSTGRVVLLDFGLATALAPDEPGVAEGGELAGTLPYMAPEQVWGTALDPAADWYSLGVLLFEALTGRLPFQGSPVEMLRAKEEGRFPRVRALRPDLPADVDELIADLLAPEAARRPTAAETLRRLDDADGLAAAPRPLSLAHAETPFVGRGAELVRLQTLLDAVRPGNPAVVHVHGGSGMGKSELVRRFLASLAAERAALVLRGRCYPQESVPYKAVDSLVDALSRYLLSVPPPQLAALTPPHAAALTRLFPVLGRVPALAADDLERDAEPHEVRRRGFQALRELLTRIASARPVVLWIDDLQWGDLDSALLVHELLRAPDAPALFVLLSYRSEDRAGSPFLRALESGPDALPAELRDQLAVGPLPRAEARALAEMLYAAAAPSGRHLDEIAAESAGSPFFVGELVRHTAAGSAAPAGRGLAAVMNARIGQLPADARAILEVVSVAGRPLDRSLALAAAGIGERGRALVSSLGRSSLVRSTVLGDHAAVETYHDRIREMVVEDLPPERLRVRHRQLADALSREPDPDPQALLRHYLGAGLVDLAARHAVDAAARAARALAFDRAAELYRQAIDLHGGGAEEWSLRLGLAEALANTGRGGEAAEAFLAAATALAQRNPGSAEVVALKRRAAEQDLRSGHIQRGAALMREVLAELGVTLPRTSRRAVASSILLRARLMLRGTRFEERSAARIPRRALLRLDACWAAGTALVGVDPVVADGVGVRCLFEALNVGARSHVIRGLALEALREAALGGRFFERRSVRLLRAAERIASAADEPYEQGWLRYCLGASAYFGARWRTARVECETSVAILREHCRGVAWEIVTGDSFALTALAHMGELRTLGERLPAAIRDGDQRGDVYAATSLRMGMPGMLWLAQDRPHEVRELADEGLARWPTTTYLVQHYLHLIATVQALLYAGEAWEAWRRVCRAWDGLCKAYIVSRVAVARAELLYLRARAALAAAAHEEHLDATATRDQLWSKTALVRLARAQARRLARERLPSARAYAPAIAAGVASLEGRDQEAIARLAEAAQAFGRADMGLHAAAMRHREGRLRGGETGAVLMRESEAWMRAQEIRNPAAMVATLAPGV